jgi:hypothetical protein
MTLRDDIYSRVLEGDAQEIPPEPTAPASERAPRRQPRRITTLDASELAAPLAPVHFLVEALGIGVGAPVLVAGFGFSGKTMASQDLALSVASGTDLFGLFRVRKGSVLHLDYEQGQRITQERYQRLALGRNINLASLGDALRLGVFPEMRLSDKDAGDVLAQAFDGVTLCIIDSLKACATGIDENSSEVREILDLANRASEKTGTTVLFIHHARKPSKEGSDDPTYAIRGSGGIFDAAGSAFVFQGVKGRPVTIHHQKCRNRGITVESFGIQIEDVPSNGNPRAGVRVRHLNALQMVQAAPADKAYDKQMQRILELLQTGPFLGPRGALFERIKGNKQSFHSALRELESRGVVTEKKDGAKTTIRLGSEGSSVGLEA